MSFELTPGQAEAVQMVDRLLDDDNPAFGVLTGFAGTGKTTLLRVIAEKYDAPLILCPTGKAAIRVKEATGGLDACTIHKYLYKPVEDPKTGDPIWAKKPIDEIDLPANGLVVVDEASMVGDQLWRDIWSLCSKIGLKVLLVGDRFQLAPVKPEDGGFSTLTSLVTPYRADLTEVVRQALDNPIIKASMLIRDSEEGTMEAIMGMRSVAPGKLVEEFLSMAPSKALIVWRNATRQLLNLQVRKALAQPDDDIAPGEPLLVMYNNYDLDRFNGEVVQFDKWLTVPAGQIAVRNSQKNLSMMASYGLASIKDLDVPAMLSPEVVFDRVGGMPAKTMGFYSKVHARDRMGYEKQREPTYLSANFGYALTAHKAQGSEFDDVLVVIEGGMKWLDPDGRRWLYTSLTRAKQNTSICFL